VAFWRRTPPATSMGSDRDRWRRGGALASVSGRRQPHPSPYRRLRRQLAGVDEVLQLLLVLVGGRSARSEDARCWMILKRRAYVSLAAREPSSRAGFGPSRGAAPAEQVKERGEGMRRPALRTRRALARADRRGVRARGQLCPLSRGASTAAPVPDLAMLYAPRALACASASASTQVVAVVSLERGSSPRGRNNSSRVSSSG